MYPSIPPIVFKITSSISAVLPITLCANSIEHETKIDKNNV